MEIRKTNEGWEVLKNNQTICSCESEAEAKKVLAYLREKARQ